MLLRNRRKFSIAASVSIVTLIAMAGPLGATSTPPRSGSGIAQRIESTTNLFTVIQFNLCGSGQNEKCFRGSAAIHKAAEIIVEKRPNVVTLSEVCNRELAHIREALQLAHPGQAIRGFFTRVPRPSGEDITCKPDAEEPGVDRGIFGVAVYTHMHPDQTVNGGGVQYPVRDPSDNTLLQADVNERRAFASLTKIDVFHACTSHLTVANKDVAMNQCKYLMNTVFGYVWTGNGQLPSVMGGDLNLEYGDDVQKCVPAGWYRKGHGVDHIMATNDLPFHSKDNIDMDGTTDHDAWLMRMQAP